MRKITVNGAEFRYMVGYQFVRIVTPNWPMVGSQSVVVPCHVVKGCTPDTFERGQWKKTSDGMVTPKEIAAWIATHDTRRQLPLTRRVHGKILKIARISC